MVSGSLVEVEDVLASFVDVSDVDVSDDEGAATVVVGMPADSSVDEVDEDVEGSVLVAVDSAADMSLPQDHEDRVQRIASVGRYIEPR